MYSARQHIKKSRERSNSSSTKWDHRARSPIFFDPSAHAVVDREATHFLDDNSAYAVLHNEAKRHISNFDKKARSDVVTLPNIHNAPPIRGLEMTPQVGSARNNCSSASSRSSKGDGGGPRARRTGKVWTRRRARQLLRGRRKKKTKPTAVASASAHST